MPLIDKYAKTEIGIDFIHSLVHRSKLFNVYAANTIAAAGTLALHITTHVSLEAHIALFIAASLSGSFIFREADTLQGGTGTAVTPRNYDRVSVATAYLSAKKDATVTVPGTILETSPIGGGGNASRIGGESRSEIEWILKSGTTYTIIFTADANNTVVTLGGAFYEVAR